MATFIRISKEEMEGLYSRKPKKAPLDLSPYIGLLQDLSAGEGGKVILEPSETPRTIKRRLTIAAKRQGMKIKYRKSAEGTVVFQVV